MKTKFNTRVLTGTAMLAAVATVLMYMEFPIPIMPAFIKLDVSELPALIASFAYGPVAGIVVCLIKNLIKLPSTSTAAVGELFNFVMGALFVGVAGMVYRFKKTRSGAILGAVLGALVMAIVSVPYNYFIVYPAYVVMYHLRTGSPGKGSPVLPDAADQLHLLADGTRQQRRTGRPGRRGHADHAQPGPQHGLDLEVHCRRQSRRD